MKNIFNIFIINALLLTNTFGQDSLKNKSSEEEISISIEGKTLLKNQKQTRQLLKEFSKEDSRFVTRNKSYQHSPDGTWRESNAETNKSFKKMPDGSWQEIDSATESTNNNSEDNPIEKKKVISKSFTVDAKDKLSINNQHGEVKVELWNKNEIKVDITIMGYGNSEKKAQELLDNVEIIDKREGEKISFKTLIDSDNDSWSWGNNWSWKSDKKEEENIKKGVEVNYMIYMPRTNSLAVSNKYGKTIIAQFAAPLRVTSNYGSFTSDRLTGADKDIFVQYGSSNIKQMDDGDLHIAYSKLNIDKADNLKLTNNYGSVTLDDINNLDGTFQYSSGKIGRINETGKLSISYSDGVQLSELSKTLKSLDIRSNYTAVKLPVNGDVNADFEVTTTYANFRYPQGKLTFTVNPDENDDDDRKMGWQSTKTYKGKIGKGSNTKITIKTNYAGVKFLEK